MMETIFNPCTEHIYVGYINGKSRHICAYCGKELEEHEYNDYREYERHLWIRCDCEDAKKELELEKQKDNIKKEIKNLEKKLSDVDNEFPKVRYVKVNDEIFECKKDFKNQFSK